MPRVLVVDDDSMVCMAIEIYLERHDFRVTIADGGEAGLRALEGALFDLMIVDIFMPHMRGFESTRRFHERAPTVPLIAISGSAFSALDAPSPDFLRMAVRLGATRCLRKPFKPTTLLGVMDECLSEAEPHRRYIATLTAVAGAPVGIARRQEFVERVGEGKESRGVSPRASFRPHASFAGRDGRPSRCGARLAGTAAFS